MKIKTIVLFPKNTGAFCKNLVLLLSSHSMDNFRVSHEMGIPPVRPVSHLSGKLPYIMLQLVSCAKGSHRVGKQTLSWTQARCWSSLLCPNGSFCFFPLFLLKKAASLRHWICPQSCWATQQRPQVLHHDHHLPFPYSQLLCWHF